jgi:hypothetical protein
MKGSITITDTIGIVTVAIMMVGFITQLFPQILSIIADNFFKASAESVARQLSNLITVSGAATYKIEIRYTPTKDVDYRISIVSRMINVMPKFKVSYADKSSSTQPFAVNLQNQEHEDVNSFLIKKELIDRESRYDFSASKS